MSIRVSPPSVEKFDYTDIASAQWYAAFSGVDDEANGSLEPASLNTVLELALAAGSFKAANHQEPIRLKSVLTLSIVRSIVERAATDCGHALPDDDPIFAWLQILMTWSDLGEDRKLVLSRMARGNAIPVIDIFGVSEGASSTTIFD